LPFSPALRAQKLSYFDKVLQVERTKHFPFCGKLHLSQNYPNPVNQNETSLINYRAIDASFASILIYDSSGEVVLSEKVDAGVGDFEINGAMLDPGEYQYALIINGRRVFVRKFTVLASKIP
jgi:hypothetical protein